MTRSNAHPIKSRKRVSQSVTNVRKRAAALNLESLEERTLLSGSTETASAILARASSASSTFHALTSAQQAFSTLAPSGHAIVPISSSAVASAHGTSPPVSPLVPSAGATNGSGSQGNLGSSVPSGSNPASRMLFAQDTVTLASKIGPVSGVWSGLTTAGSGTSPAGGGSGPGGGIAPQQIVGAYGGDLTGVHVRRCHRRIWSDRGHRGRPDHRHHRQRRQPRLLE